MNLKSIRLSLEEIIRISNNYKLRWQPSRKVMIVTFRKSLNNMKTS